MARPADFEWNARRTLLLILGLAVALRVWGLTFGLPHVYHTDEWFEVKRALKLGAGVFDLERFGKGGYYYLLFVLFGFHYVIQKLLGNVSGSADFLLSIFRDPTSLWIVGRSATAVIGTLNVWFIYRAGLALGNRAVGLIAAASLAVHMLHVRSSHSITVDVPLVCLLTLGWALLYRWQGRDDLGVLHYVALASVTAAATGTKLPGAVFAVCVLVMHARLFRRTGRWNVLDYLFDRRFLAYVAAGAVAYVAIEPGFVFKIGYVFEKLVSFVVPGTATPGVAQLPYAVIPGRFESMPAYYAGALFPAAYTVLPLLFLAGAVSAVRRDGLLRHTALIFALIYAAFLLSSKDAHHIYARYVLPLVPVVLVYAALAVVELHRKLASRSTPWRLVAPALAMIVWIPMLVDSIRLDLDYGRPDTRTAAKEWIEANVPAGESIYLAGGVVTASPTTAQLRIMPERVDEKVGNRLEATGGEMTRERSAYYEVYKQALREYSPTYDLILLDEREELRRALEQDSGKWVLLADYTRPLFEHEANRRAFPEKWALHQRINSGDFEVVRRFPQTKGWAGPGLTLYKRSARAEEIR